MLCWIVFQKCLLFPHLNASSRLNASSHLKSFINTLTPSIFLGYTNRQLALQCCIGSNVGYEKLYPANTFLQVLKKKISLAEVVCRNSVYLPAAHAHVHAHTHRHTLTPPPPITTYLHLHIQALPNLFISISRFIATQQDIFHTTL